MSRRKQCGEQEFGSDSFLDIIANIVGILIILIVIAGMKVARQPANVVEDSVQAVLAGIPEPNDIEPQSPSGLVVESLPQPNEDIPLFDTDSAEAVEPPSIPDLANPFAEFETPAALQPSPPEVASDDPSIDDESVGLNQEIASLTLQLENVGLEISASQEKLTEIMEQLDSKFMSSEFSDSRLAGLVNEQELVVDSIETLEKQLGTGEVKTQQFQATLTSLTDRQHYITQALRQVSQETRRLQEVLLEADEDKPNSDRLKHRISPVSRDATEGELHFQLAGGKVAHIPLDQLLQRLKGQVSQRRNIVKKFYRSEGIVGPVGGFRMNYIVERQAAAPLQSLQYGGSAFRIMVSRWTILPAETLEAETVDAALKLGSRFRQVIEGAEPNTVLTIWLYPEDFPRFGELRELGHRFNLRVAARPLPNGTPIAGSPSGSRSASQ